MIDEAEPRAARRSIRWVENNTHWSAIGSSLRWSAIRPVTNASFILTLDEKPSTASLRSLDPEICEHWFKFIFQTFCLFVLSPHAKMLWEQVFVWLNDLSSFSQIWAKTEVRMVSPVSTKWFIWQYAVACSSQLGGSQENIDNNIWQVCCAEGDLQIRAGLFLHIDSQIYKYLQGRNLVKVFHSIYCKNMFNVGPTTLHTPFLRHLFDPFWATLDRKEKNPN